MAEQQKKVQEQDINQLRKVRREKLAELQSSGRNPFEITKYDTTCHAIDIKNNYEEMEGKQVRLAGVLCRSVSWARLPSAIFLIRAAISSLMWQETV